MSFVVVRRRACTRQDCKAEPNFCSFIVQVTDIQSPVVSNHTNTKIKNLKTQHCQHVPLLKPKIEGSALISKPHLPVMFSQFSSLGTILAGGMHNEFSSRSGYVCMLMWSFYYSDILCTVDGTHPNFRDGHISCCIMPMLWSHAFCIWKHTTVLKVSLCVNFFSLSTVLL